MSERPILDRNLDSKTFRDFYYLKEELVNFCRENDIPVSGGKVEITDRIAYFLDTGKILSAQTARKRTMVISTISEDTKIEANFVCSENIEHFQRTYWKRFFIQCDFSKMVKKQYRENL